MVLMRRRRWRRLAERPFVGDDIGHIGGELTNTGMLLYSMTGVISVDASSWPTAEPLRSQFRVGSQS